MLTSGRRTTTRGDMNNVFKQGCCGILNQFFFFFLMSFHIFFQFKQEERATKAREGGAFSGLNVELEQKLISVKM